MHGLDTTPSTKLCVCCRFWYQYSNINALVGELGIDNPFTEWTRSSFWAPDGLQAMPYLSEHDALQLFAVSSLIGTIDFTAMHDGLFLKTSYHQLQTHIHLRFEAKTFMCAPRLRDTQHNEAIYHI